jgi:hypothetical protein
MIKMILGKLQALKKKHQINQQKQKQLQDDEQYFDPSRKFRF